MVRRIASYCTLFRGTFENSHIISSSGVVLYRGQSRSGMVQRLPVALTADQARPKTAEHQNPGSRRPSASTGAGSTRWSSAWWAMATKREDLALEAFWRLYRRSPVLDENKLGGWLYRVATNLGFNALRARRRRQQYEGQAGASQPSSRANPVDPAQAVEQTQERQRVQAALGTHETALCPAAGFALLGPVLCRDCRGDGRGARLRWHPAGSRRSRIRALLPPPGRRIKMHLSDGELRAYLDHQPGRLTTEQAKAAHLACLRPLPLAPGDALRASARGRQPPELPEPNPPGAPCWGWLLPIYRYASQKRRKPICGRKYSARVTALPGLPWACWSSWGWR